MSYKYQATGNVRPTDTQAGRRYLPSRLQVPADNGGTYLYCACTDVSGVRLSTEKFGPGQIREFWSPFALPEDAATLNVKIADFGELEVPVQ
ncbi:hypothetical protein [Streptosporangium amethystogenes]|uniref:hypothetical protein n=1 Tax=Streptosporangium amethystogenes TaxID=2002 RepID=UPI0004C5F748|nr:hypothetical protein [Streptosporangium amethystogenes]